MADFVRVPETDWQNILDATRGKTGGTEKMLSGEVAAAIAGIQAGGGGGSMESGELTCTNYYRFTVPVTSKKNYFLMYPKVIEDSTHDTGRISYFLVADGLFVWHRRPTKASYFSTTTTSVFSDDEIEVKDSLGAPYNLGDYNWFAW